MNTPLWFSNLLLWSAQVALIVFVAGTLPRLFQVREPRILSPYWRIILLLVVLLPFVQPWHRIPSVAPVVFFSPADTIHSVSPPAPTHWHFPDTRVIAEVIGIAILGGIVFRFALCMLGLFKLRRLRWTSAPIRNNDASAAILNQMLVTVGVTAEFRISATIDSPVTFGLNHPVVLLPERFVTTDPRTQSVIACHELLHIRRRDWAQHLLEEIVRAIFWFHPAIAWLISRIRLTREQLVDLEVVRLTNARKAYLEALVDFTSHQPRAAILLAPPFLAEQQLVERISLMLKEVHMSRGKLIACLSVISFCLVAVVALSAWSLPLKRAPLPSFSAATSDVSSEVINDAVSGVVQDVSKGVVEGVSRGVAGGVSGGVTGGVAGGARGAVATDTPKIDSSTLWIDTVKRGPMLRQVRGMGKLAHGDGAANMVAQLNLPDFMTADIKPGQSASIATQKGPLANGHVVSVNSSASGDSRTVIVELDALPAGSNVGLDVAGTIDIEKIDNVLHVGRPVQGTQNGEISIFKLDSKGADASRVTVKFGRASVDSVEVLAGLKEGDRVILSDMSSFGNADHVHLQ